MTGHPDVQIFGGTSLEAGRDGASEPASGNPAWRFRLFVGSLAPSGSERCSSTCSSLLLSKEARQNCVLMRWYLTLTVSDHRWPHIEPGDKTAEPGLPQSVSRPKGALP